MELIKNNAKLNLQIKIITAYFTLSSISVLQNDNLLLVLIFSNNMQVKRSCCCSSTILSRVII